MMDLEAMKRETEWISEFESERTAQVLRLLGELGSVLISRKGLWLEVDSYREIEDTGMGSIICKYPIRFQIWLSAWECQNLLPSVLRKVIDEKAREKRSELLLKGEVQRENLSRHREQHVSS